MLEFLFDRFAPYIKLSPSSLKFQTIQVFVARVGALSLALLCNLALTRWLGISIYGEYTYILAWVTILSIPGVGMGTLVMRETAVARRQADDAKLGGLIRWSFSSTLSIGGALTLTGIVAVSLSARYASNISPLAPIIGMAVVPLMLLQTNLSALFRGCRRVELSVFLSETVSMALMVAWAAGCLFLGVQASASMALGGRLVTLCAIVLIFALMLPRLKLPRHSIAAARDQISAWRKSRASLALLKGVSITEGHLPVLMLGFALGPEPVALFSLASRIAHMVVLALSIVVMTTGPRLAELHANKEYQNMQRLVTRSTIAISAWALPIALGLVIAGRWLLSWFGPSFVDGYPILVILVIGQMVNAITGTVGVVMTMGGLEKVVLRTQIYGLTITAVLCLALIPIWGGIGAAVGSTIALIFWNIALTVKLYRRLGIASSFYSPFISGQ
jgi:O-antigen/teichoic acid export membrane protein